MSVITLTSDWNQNDYYLAAVKGQLLKLNENFRLVDLNHQIPPFNAAQAAFILRNSFYHFPKNSIHLIFVDAEPSEDRKILAIKSLDHYFIGTDNGIFSLILNEEPVEIIELSNKEPQDSTSFPGLISFTEAAFKISKGDPLETIGTSIEKYNDRVPLRATIEEKAITGSIIYIDSYGNAITNITRELFERIGHKKAFEIYVQSKYYTLNEIHSSYRSMPPGELLAVFNSIGLLEIAINNGNASRLLNLNQNSNIRIEFLN